MFIIFVLRFFSFSSFFYFRSFLVFVCFPFVWNKGNAEACVTQFWWFGWCSLGTRSVRPRMTFSNMMMASIASIFFLILSSLALKIECTMGEVLTAVSLSAAIAVVYNGGGHGSSNSGPNTCTCPVLDEVREYERQESQRQTHVDNPGPSRWASRGYPATFASDRTEAVKFLHVQPHNYSCRFVLFPAENEGREGKKKRDAPLNWGANNEITATALSAWRLSFHFNFRAYPFYKKIITD